MTNKYDRPLAKTRDEVTVDVYDVLKAFKVHCPATQHAVKKLLCAGLRGQKNCALDLFEAGLSISRALRMHQESERVTDGMIPAAIFCGHINQQLVDKPDITFQTGREEVRKDTAVSKMVDDATALSYLQEAHKGLEGAYRGMDMNDVGASAVRTAMRQVKNAMEILQG